MLRPLRPDSPNSPSEIPGTVHATVALFACLIDNPAPGRIVVSVLPWVRQAAHKERPQSCAAPWVAPPPSIAARLSSLLVPTVSDRATRSSQFRDLTVTLRTYRVVDTVRRPPVLPWVRQLA